MVFLLPQKKRLTSQWHCFGHALFAPKRHLLSGFQCFDLGVCLVPLAFSEVLVAVLQSVAKEENNDEKKS